MLEKLMVKMEKRNEIKKEMKKIRKELLKYKMMDNSLNAYLKEGSKYSKEEVLKIDREMKKVKRNIVVSNERIEFLKQK